MSHVEMVPNESTYEKKRNRVEDIKPLKILIIGFGNFGQFLAKTFNRNHHVVGSSNSDTSEAAKSLGCEYITLQDLIQLNDYPCEVILIAVSIISFEEVLNQIPKEMLKGKLIVDVLSVKVHARNTMLASLPADCDILCTHPMFGPESGKFGWQGLNFMYEKVRISNNEICDQFLSIWETERCKMIEMSCEQHDEYAANSQFITHLTGRILGNLQLELTPIDTKNFEYLHHITQSTMKNSADLFLGLYRYNPYASTVLERFKEGMGKVELQLSSDTNGNS